MVQINPDCVSLDLSNLSCYSDFVDPPSWFRPLVWIEVQSRHRRVQKLGWSYLRGARRGHMSGRAGRTGESPEAAGGNAWCFCSARSWTRANWEGPSATAEGIEQNLRGLKEEEYERVRGGLLVLALSSGFTPGKPGRSGIDCEEDPMMTC